MNTRRRRPPSWPKPHPDNIALVGPQQPFEGFPSVREWVQAKISTVRSSTRSTVNTFAYWSWMALYDYVEKRIEGFLRHPVDQPVSPATIRKLRRLMTAIRRELDDSRPY